MNGSKSNAKRRRRGGAPEAPLITAIEPLASNPNMRKVFVHGKPVVMLRATDIESLRIRTGMTWTAEASQRAADAVAANEARALAMRLLGRRGFARAELISRLEQRGCDVSIAERVTAELVRDGWLSDRDRAEAIVRQTTRKGPASRPMLMAKLTAHGIQSDLASSIADAARAGRSDLRDAVMLAKHALSAQRSKLPPAAVARRIASLLARRGFDHDTIASALERAGLTRDDAESMVEHGVDDS